MISLLSKKAFLVLISFISVGVIGCSDKSADSVNTTSYNKEAAELYVTAQEHYRNKSFTRAITLLDSAINKFENKPDLYFLKGLALMKINQFKPSIQSFSQALALDPDFKGANFQIGHAYSLMEQYETALDFYQREMRNEEGSDDLSIEAKKSLYLQVSRTFNHLSMIDSAEHYLEEAIQMDSEFAAAYADLADLHKKDGNLNRALELYQKAMELKPNEPSYRFNYGHLLYQTGHTDQAVTHLKQTVENFPWHHGAHNTLGRALMTLGMEDSASYHINRADTLQDIGYDIATYKLNTKTFPDDAKRWVELGAAYQSVGRYQEAMDAYTVGENLQPYNLNILNRMANLAYEMENPGQAIRLYKRIVSLKVDEPKIWYNLGLAYMMDGKLDLGRRALERSLQYDPDFSPARVYLSRL